MTEARPSKASERPVYRLLLRPEPGCDGDRALRQALKALLRRFKLRCVAVEQVREPR
jgi:hypothetical protein